MPDLVRTERHGDAAVIVLTGADPAFCAGLDQDWAATDRLPLEEARRVHYEHAARGGFGSATGAGIASRREAVIARARTAVPTD